MRPAPRRGWRGGPSPAGARRARPGRRRGGAAASPARRRDAASAGSAAATGSPPGCRPAPRGSRRRLARVPAPGAADRLAAAAPPSGRARTPHSPAWTRAPFATLPPIAGRTVLRRTSAGVRTTTPPAPRRARDGRPVLGGRAAAGSAPEPPAPAGTPPSATAAGSPPCPAATQASSVSTPPSGRAGGSPAAGPRRSCPATARTSAPPRPSPRAICRSGRFRPVRQGHGTRTRGGRRWPAGAVPVGSSERAAHASRRWRWRRRRASPRPWRTTAALPHPGRRTPSGRRCRRTGAWRFASSIRDEGFAGLAGDTGRGRSAVGLPASDRLPPRSGFVDQDERCRATRRGHGPRPVSGRATRLRPASGHVVTPSPSTPDPETSHFPLLPTPVITLSGRYNEQHLRGTAPCPAVSAG